MLTYAIKATASGSLNVVEFDKSKSYETIKDAIGGGTFDCVRIPTLGVDMWIDDEGKLVEKPEFNIFGSALWATEYGMTDLIAGDVLITGGVDEEGKTMGLSKDKAIETLNAIRDKIISISSILPEAVAEEVK